MIIVAKMTLFTTYPLRYWLPEFYNSTTIRRLHCSYQLWSRDIRLEATANNTKKIRGQGQRQPFQEQTLSRPRAGMLEAKNQEHRRKCSQKKKSIKNFFQAISKKKRSSKIFAGEKGFKNFFFRQFPIEENKKGLR